MHNFVRSEHFLTEVSFDTAENGVALGRFETHFFEAQSQGQTHSTGG